MTRAAASMSLAWWRVACSALSSISALQIGMVVDELAADPGWRAMTAMVGIQAGLDGRLQGGEDQGCVCVECRDVERRAWPRFAQVLWPCLRWSRTMLGNSFALEGLMTPRKRTGTVVSSWARLRRNTAMASSMPARSSSASSER